MARYSFLFLLALVVLAVIGPTIAPYEESETLYTEEGRPLTLEEPSMKHPLGTTSDARDVFSRLLIGIRPTLITAFFGGTIIISIGTSIGLTAGYLGGRVDNVLMRFTDFIFSVPLIPFAIVLFTFVDLGFFSAIVVIGAILWRGSARVIRGEALQIKERPYIKAAKATGASTPRIILGHILPNIAPMVVLFYALGMGIAIIFQASLSFIGMTNPFVPTWGIMLRNAYNSGFIAQAWWWSLTPGLMISFTVLAMFLLGRRYEAVTSEDYGLTLEGSE